MAEESRWQQMMRWPLIVASIAFIVAYSWQVIADLQGPAYLAARIVIAATWVIFVVDYIVQLVQAKPRGLWFRKHLFALAVVLLPPLKPLRLLRAFTLVGNARTSVGAAIRSRLAIYGAGTAAILIWIASLAELEVERNAPGANIQSFGDAVWWAFVTISTVGYGDYFPVTVLGRLVAVGLMCGGVAVVGVATATLASWVIERASRGRDDEEPATRKQMRDLMSELARLQTPVGAGVDAGSARSGGAGAGDGPDPGGAAGSGGASPGA